MSLHIQYTLVIFCRNHFCVDTIILCRCSQFFSDIYFVSTVIFYRQLQCLYRHILSLVILSLLSHSVASCILSFVIFCYFLVTFIFSRFSYIPSFQLYSVVSYFLVSVIFCRFSCVLPLRLFSLVCFMFPCDFRLHFILRE